MLGTLDVLVLRALTWGPRHGYGVAQWIGESSNGRFRIMDGALYTALHRLEEQDLVEGEWGLSEKGKRARYYRITPTGRRQLASEESKWDAFARAMGLLL